MVGGVYFRAARTVPNDQPVRWIRHAPWKLRGYVDVFLYFPVLRTKVLAQEPLLHTQLFTLPEKTPALPLVPIHRAAWKLRSPRLSIIGSCKCRRAQLAGGPAEAGPHSVPEEDHPTLRHHVRYSHQVPLLDFAGIESVLDLLPGLRVLVQHQLLGEVPPVPLLHQKLLLPLRLGRFSLVIRLRRPEHEHHPRPEPPFQAPTRRGRLGLSIARHGSPCTSSKY